MLSVMRRPSRIMACCVNLHIKDALVGISEQEQVGYCSHFLRLGERAFVMR